ncbi:MAG TPA: 1-deoxy-D-xylulose-5-phosphate reductoisomerase [Bacillota bacterium]|nr:1-deoxy-D-xylulose-5-phosphate reductoisomerase [Bacillota bacterium]
MKYISILGSTGSIGRQTLDVVEQHPELFSVVGLAAGYNWEALVTQALKFLPSVVSVSTKELADRVRLQLPETIKVLYGEEGTSEVATQPKADFVVSAIVGSAGLNPTLQAIEAGKAIGLANKETLVTAGHIVMERVKQRGVPLIPIDSEHSAIFQCLEGENKESVKRLILTASGGSFRDLSRDELKGVTVQQALNHPNWKMGAKITIDSATMLNKGFEVIEAHWLFDLPFDKIDSVLHKESIIHSMVEFKDMAIKAQLGTPDMKIPIQYAMTYPKRMELETPALDFEQVMTLHFAPVDFNRYPALKLAYECGRIGGTLPTVLNAANEVMVDRFLKGEIAFFQLEHAIEEVLEKHHSVSNPGLEEIWEADQWARYEASLVTFE